MKSKLKKKIEEDHQIDWSKPQLLQYKDQTSSERVSVVLTIPASDEYILGGTRGKEQFAGVIVYSENDSWPIGYYTPSWSKDLWVPYEGSIEIQS